MGKKNKRLQKSFRQTAVLMSGKENNGAGFSGGWMSMTNWLVFLVAILPFLISYKELDAALMPRYIFLSIFILLFVFFFFLLQKKIINPGPRLIRIIFCLGIAFGIWSLLCMINAINYRESYFPVSRHLLYIILLFIVMAAVIQDESQVMKICKVVTVVALLQSLVGILQYYELAFTEIPGNYTPYGLMTNRNLFGSAQAFVLPFTIYVLYTGKKTWKAISVLTIAGIIISLLFSQTRSAWLSAGAVIIVSFLLVIFFSKSSRKKWIIGLLTGIVCTAGIVSVLLITDKAGELSQSVKERLKSLGGKVEQNSMMSFNVDERLRLWNKTVSIIKNKPIFGVGPGNWKIAIPAYGTENLIFSKGEYSPDFPHNVYLQIASETGLPGAILFFSMWLLIALLGIKVIRKTSSEKTRLLVILMLAGLTAVASDCMFSFPTERIEHSLYLILMGGIILGCYANLQGVTIVKTGQIKKILLLPAICIVFFNLFLGIKKYNFEIRWKMAYSYNNERRSAETIEEVVKGKNEFAVMDLSGTPLQFFSAHSYREMKNYDAAFKDIRLAARYHPNNSRIYSEWGTIYTDLKQFDKAIEYYKKALKLTPQFDIALKNLAVNYFNVGNYAGCIEALGKVNTDGDVYLTALFNEAKSKITPEPK